MEYITQPGGCDSLSTPHDVSYKLKKFFGVSLGTKLSRRQVSKMICDYIKSHNLGDPTNYMNIIPNDKLSKLLNYDDYVNRVLNGRVSWARMDKNSGDRIHQLETDSSLTYSVLSHLLAKHFISPKEEAKRTYYELSEFIYKLEILLNKRLPGNKYLKTEIVMI